MSDSCDTLNSKYTDSSFALCCAGDYNLRINMEDFDGVHRYAIYEKFQVSSEEVFC